MIEYRIGDVRDRLAEIPDGSIDLVVTSPPFLALRSYLPADHPDKHREIGSEPTPADFLDTMLGLTAEFDRVLAPHGSICIELGDTFASSGESGWHRTVNPAHMTEGRVRGGTGDGRARNMDNGWPLAKSLTGIPTLYTWSLAYGRNLLTGNESPAGQWRIRNVIVWARPNPPVGALGDKFRPATSYITVACKGSKRYFDLDAVRTPLLHPEQRATAGFREDGARRIATVDYDPARDSPNGAPPLDWHADDHPEDGDWLWKLSTQPYKGSHFATFPMALPKRLIEAMCPLRVCTVCGKPSERIVDAQRSTVAADASRMNDAQIGGSRLRKGGIEMSTTYTTLGWTDCGCPCATCDGHSAAQWDVSLPECPDCTDGKHAWRTGVVLDPFGGSGTTAEAAQAVGRHAILIDLDARNAELARERVGMFLEVVA